MKIRINIDLKTNRVIRTFVLVDLVLLAGWGLVAPIFSIYIVDHIAGATLVTVGAAAAIYWIIRSLLGIPIAQYLDRTSGEEDDLRALIAGLLIAAFAAFSFAFVSTVWQLYLVQIIHAIAFACYSASWPAIFSRHLDKDKVSLDWSLDNTVVGISTGVSGFLGGVIATWFGFQILFVLASLLSLLSAFILIMAPELVLPPKTRGEPVIKDHTPTTHIG